MEASNNKKKNSWEIKITTACDLPRLCEQGKQINPIRDEIVSLDHQSLTGMSVVKAKSDMCGEVRCNQGKQGPITRAFL